MYKEIVTNIYCSFCHKKWTECNGKYVSKYTCSERGMSYTESETNTLQQIEEHETNCGHNPQNKECCSCRNSWGSSCALGKSGSTYDIAEWYKDDDCNLDKNGKCKGWKPKDYKLVEV